MSLTWTSQILLKRLPTPLSLGLKQLLRESTPAQQVRQFKALLEIFLRYTSGILLSNSRGTNWIH